MKKLLPLLLVGLGAFLVVTGLGSRYYAYERLAVMPLDAQIDAVAATAPDAPATYFDIAQLKEVQGGLTNRTRIRGDVAASKDASDETGQDAVVWASYACTGPSDEDCMKTYFPLSGALESTAFAAHGSQVLDWDGAYRETNGERDDAPDTSGYVFKLPFNAGKHDYTWYNADLGTSVPLHYDRQTTVKGLRTYRYTEDVEPTKVGTIDLPGALAGSDEPTVTGDIVYSAHLEMDVEPESGVAMTTVSSPDKWVEVDGTKVLTMIRGTFSLTDETVTDNVDTYKPLATQLKLVRTWVPLAAVAAGILALLAGLLLMLRRRPTTEPGAPAQHEELHVDHHEPSVPA